MFEVDEDILQDFLVEAGEILELLSEQLVELENNPEDTELLNAIFRGFHTVKGGAGFLAMTELVDACHGAENVFDLLRQGVRTVNSELMDVILQALDTINEMFATIQNRDKPEPADPELLHTLHILGLPPTEAEATEASSQTEVEQPHNEVVDTPVADDEDPFAFDELFSGAPSVSDAEIDEITEDEFESLLDELHGKGQGPAVEKPVASSSDFSGDITDDEFDSLLDELHGVGSFGEVTSKPEQNDANKTPVESAIPAVNTVNSSDDEISDDEFEALLDELHGKGTAPKSIESAPAAKQPEPVSPPAKQVSEPVKKAEPAKLLLQNQLKKRQRSQ